MQLIRMYVRANPGAEERGVSVWVDEREPAAAAQRARTALETAGWHLERIEGSEETSAEDYFRPCASQRAFCAAQSDGIAWRFDDE